jgi:phosphoribosylamine--glycine ligase
LVYLNLQTTTIMNILILGSGGREHAFAWKIAKSPFCTQLFVAPGNAGTASIAKNVGINVLDFQQVGNFAFEHQIDMVLVGAEAPLVAGIVDYFAATPKLQHIKLLGPKKAGAILEGSKDFAKKFMQKYHIPTAGYQTFDKENLEAGLQYLDTHSLPIVLKADGLAAGKGVIIAESRGEAKATLTEMLNGKFGEASAKVVVEEFLRGIELSVFVLTDGKNYKILPSAKDYKRVGEGDKGLNTGGMGAVSPVPFATAEFLKKVEDKIVKPTLRGFQEENIDYQGFIFIGLMNNGGEPAVVEYNVRMGDPETEVVVPRIKSDLLALFDFATKGQLDKAPDLEIDSRIATTIMLVSGGYPESFEKGKEIKNIEKVKGVKVFQAATVNKNGKILTDGGRVLTVTALAATMPEALEKANAAAKIIDFEGKYYRRDIGFDLQ